MRTAALTSLLIAITTLGCAHADVSPGTSQATAERLKQVRAHAVFVEVQRRDPPAACDFVAGTQMKEEDYPRALRALRLRAVERHANFVALDGILPDEEPGQFRVMGRLYACPVSEDEAQLFAEEKAAEERRVAEAARLAAERRAAAEARLAVERRITDEQRAAEGRPGRGVGQAKPDHAPSPAAVRAAADLERVERNSRDAQELEAHAPATRISFDHLRAADVKVEREVPKQKRCSPLGDGTAHDPSRSTVRVIERIREQAAAHGANWAVLDPVNVGVAEVSAFARFYACEK